MLEAMSIRNTRKIRFSFQLSIILLLFITILSIVPYDAEKDDVEAVDDHTTPASLSFISANDHATVAINPSTAGTFGASSGDSDIRFTVSTNNYTGYTLTVKATKTTLDSTTDGVISTLASSVTTSQFSNASNTPLSNRWGYKPNYYNSSTNSDRFYPATSDSVILDKTVAANTTAKAYIISLGARVNYEIPSGTYENNTLMLQYVANPVPYTVSFNDNVVDDIVNNMPSSLTGNSSSPDTVTLPSRIPTRDYYAFAGWCTVKPIEVAGGQLCPGTAYSANGSYGLNYTVSNSNNVLYAIWTSNRGCNKAATTIGTGVSSTDAVCMQDINNSVISSMVTGVQHSLVDMRDGKSYFIAKQSDGKVWMTQNLDYVLSTSTTLTHHSTDIGYTDVNLDKTFSPSTNTITTESEWSMSENTLPFSYDPGDIYYYSSGTTDDDTPSTACNDTSTCKHYHVGNYYTWTAAVASNDTSSMVDTYSIAPDSICPANWRLPSGTNNDTYNEFNRLLVKSGVVTEYASKTKLLSYTTNGFTLLRSAPLYITRSGAIWTPTLSYSGKNGYLWNDTITSSTAAGTFNMNKNYLNYSATLTRRNGFPIRCVARMNAGSSLVNYYGNGATDGVQKSVTIKKGNTLRFPTDIFTRQNYILSGWNSKADGTGLYYDFDSIYDVEYNSPAVIDFYAVWTPAYSIVYNGNGSSNDSAMGVNNIVKNGDETRLFASNYRRDGYGFVGWSVTQIDPDAANAKNLISNAKIFGPNEKIIANNVNLGSNAPANITLYAVWIKSEGDMQNWVGCPSMNIGDLTARKDIRDNQVYAIAKLADGKCWMIENLRLDANGADNKADAQGFDTGFLGLATAESESNFTYSVIASNSLYTTSNITGENQAYRFPRYNNRNTNDTVEIMTSVNENIYSYGNYYSWPAAKASIYNFTFNDNSITVNSSICPKGWKLPSANNSGTDTSTLISSLRSESKMLYHFPNNFVYSGTINNRNSYGDIALLWADNYNGAQLYPHHAHTIYSSATYNTDSAIESYPTYYGLPVRCISTNNVTIADVSYLQSFKNYSSSEVDSIAASMPYNTTYNLVDNRDNKTYKIAKLKDDNIWMVENLDLGRTTLTTSLTSSNTNLSTSISASTFNSWKKTTGSRTFNNGEFINVDGTDSFNGVAYGTLYNYFAASAGTVSGQSYDFIYTTNDICPAGWRLPAEGIYANYYTLFKIYNNEDSANYFSNIRSPVASGGAALNLSGTFYSSPTGIGSTGSYWAAGWSSSNAMRCPTLDTSNTAFYPNLEKQRDLGASIRCVAKRTLYPLTVKYGEGVVDVKVNGVSVQDGGIINIEKNTAYPISATVSDGYAFYRWSKLAKPGLINNFRRQSTTLTMSDEREVLTATALPKMQYLDTGVCTSASSKVIDERDNHVYTIKRLNDGNCWMMEDLDLGRTALTTDLTSNNTNLSATITAATFNGWKNTTGIISYTTGVFVPLSGTDSASGTPYGVLYNYHAASAGTITGNSNSANASFDICPSGWKLPTSGNGGEFQTLYEHYNSNALLTAPISQNGAAFAYNGSFYNTVPSGLGTAGGYWSSTVSNNSNMYFIGFNTSTIYPSNSTFRTTGHGIRCIMKNSTRTLTISYGAGVASVKVNSVSILNGNTIDLEPGVSYTIEMTPSTGYVFDYWSATSGTIGSTTTQTTTYSIGSNNATLTVVAASTAPVIQNLPSASCTTTASLARDNRDDHIYTVQRLADGRCWIMENLDLGRTTLTANLTSANTNLVSTVSATTFNGWKKTSGTQTYDAGEFISVSGSDTTSQTPYGTLYNYYAASAGTITGSSNSVDASYDICPAGWRLPTGSTNGEFKKLYDQYNSLERIRASIANNGAAFAFAGYFTSGVPAGQDNSGDYWASTRHNDTVVGRLVLNTSSVNSTSFGYRNSGRSIRCIMKQTTRVLTVTYNTGVAHVKVNGITVQNGGMIILEQGLPYPIEVTLTSGYEFTNWSTKYGTIDSTTAQTTTYRIGSNNDTLTATAASSIPSIQNYPSASCTTAVSQAKDNRDDHVYTIKRLADGNCWMMENLDLGRTTLTTDLTSSNTNLSTTVTASTFNSWKTTSGSSKYNAGEFITVNGSDYTSNNPYGTLYNYYAASAGTISGDVNYNNASYDICPAGWRLPTGGSGGEFETLYSHYNSYALMTASAANGGAAFAAAGRFWDGTNVLDGSNGYYWASSRSTDTDMYYLMFFGYNTTIFPNSADHRYLGFSIRCVLKEPLTIQKMSVLQSFNNISSSDKSSIMNSMTTGTTYNLIDNRDNKTYRIAKLKDGLIWMVDNLDLGRTNLSVDLTSANTNLSSTVSASTFNAWRTQPSTYFNYSTGYYLPLSGSDANSNSPYGTLYNFYAASAGTISGTTNENDSIYDICPAGWKLPDGNTSTGNYISLVNSGYGSVGLLNASPSSGGANFAYSGYINAYNMFYDAGITGTYWSSTHYTGEGRISLTLVPNSNQIAFYEQPRYFGLSIRCILK